VTVRDSRSWFDEGRKWYSRRFVREALSCFSAAEQSGFDPGECAAARWNCWMLLGEFERAWKESDFIANRRAYDPHRMWNGESWADRRVMLRCLHGLGDTIQFIRYAPLLRSTCRHLTVQTHPQLVTLLQGVDGIDRVITWGEDSKDDEWDMQLEITELPRAFRTTLASLPVDIPYLEIPDELTAWACRLLPASDQPRVGVSWQAGSWCPSRAVSLQDLENVFTVDGIHFYSLQKGATDEDICPARVLRALETYAQDVRDTAALVLNLDLVITVDTVTAHLAGALGRPVWIMIPFEADWRWMLDVERSPWYPTARLFRQRRENDWTDVVAEIATALTNHFQISDQRLIRAF
jgi:hypothetical protein